MSKPFRIGLIMQGGQGWIGGSEYIKNIILALGSLPADIRSTFEIYLILNNPLNQALVDEISPYIHSIDDAYLLEEGSSRPSFFQKQVIEKLKRRILGTYDLKFEAWLKKHRINFVYPYFTQKSKLPYQTAAWIYDFQHKYLPEFFTESEISARDASFARIAKYSSAIVLSSKTAEQDFQKFFPEAAQKSRVLSFKTIPQSKWYEADPAEVQRKYHLPDRFFLISNQFWQHKNHLVVFEALKILQRSSIHPIVVCTGHLYDYRQPDYVNTILQAIHTAGIAPQVYLLGLIPKADQLQLLRRSITVIQPSLFEGWNTTVEDARVLGKPLILSDIAVHLEQCPPRSRFFSAKSPEQLAQVMAESWQTLPAGPDLAVEEIARSNSISEIQHFAKTFLAICQR